MTVGATSPNKPKLFKTEEGLVSSQCNALAGWSENINKHVKHDRYSIISKRCQNNFCMNNIRPRGNLSVLTQSLRHFSFILLLHPLLPLLPYFFSDISLILYHSRQINFRDPFKKFAKNNFSYTVICVKYNHNVFVFVFIFVIFSGGWYDPRSWHGRRWSNKLRRIRSHDARTMNTHACTHARTHAEWTNMTQEKYIYMEALLPSLL